MAVFWTVFAGHVFAIALVFFINLFTGGWASAQFRPGGAVAGQWLILSISTFLVFAVMSVWAERIGAGPFGAALRSSSDWIAIGAITGPVVLVACTTLTAFAFSGGDPDWMLREGYDQRAFSRAALGPLMIATVLLIVPLLEEVAFRGIALGCLLGRGWPPAAATAVTAATFAALHTNYTWPALIPIFIMGLYLGALRVVSGSLGPPLAAHIAANGVSLLMLAWPGS